MNVINRYQKLILVFLASPIWLNFIYNNYENFDLNTFNIQNLFLKVFTTLILFLIIYMIGSALKNKFKLDSISSSIVIYLISFYIFNYYFLYFFKELETRNLFIIFNLIIFFILTYKSISNIKTIVVSIILFVLLNILYTEFNFYEYLVFKDFITTDETRFWFPKSKIFSETNMYQIYIGESLYDNKSFGLLVHSSFVFLESVFHFENGYIFSQIIPNISFALFSLFIYENFKISFNTLFGYFTLVILFLTSNWFTYFIFNSHLGETFSTLYFGILVISLAKNISNQRNSLIYLFFLSTLIYSKRFLLIGVLIAVLLFFFYTKQKKASVAVIFLSSFPIIYNYLLMGIPILWTIDSEPSRGIQYKEVLYNFDSIKFIINQFLIDKPVSFFILITLLLFIFNFKNFNFLTNFITALLFFNSAFVFLYFIFVSSLENAWDDSYRYLLNPIYLIFYLFFFSLDNNLRSNSEY